jgi:hypothetical protein
MSIISSASGSVLISSGTLNSNYSGSVAYGPKQVSDGLVLYVDAANPLSYAGSGNIWYDLTRNGYNGALSGSAAVVPSWDSIHQGRIHVKASSSYAIPGDIASLSTPMSSSFINFGKILDEVFVGGNNPYSIPAISGGGTTYTGTNSKFTLNLWFELNYDSQIVQSVAGSFPAITRNWRQNYTGNVPCLISKYGDSNTIETSGFQSSGQPSNNSQFRLILFDISSSFTASAYTPRPSSYRFSFSINEDPLGSANPRQTSIVASQPRIINDTPTNVCVTFDSSIPIIAERIKIYVNGNRTTGNTLTTSSIAPIGSYTGSNSQLALGAEIGATPRQLEGSINGLTNTDARGTAAQIDAKYYMFQVYDRALSSQEIKQNYYAHKYRFIY